MIKIEKIDDNISTNGKIPTKVFILDNDSDVNNDPLTITHVNGTVINSKALVTS